MSTSRPVQAPPDRRVRTARHSSINPAAAGLESSSAITRNTLGHPVGRRPWVVSILAGAGVFATVLASQPVYGQPPQRGQHSSTSAPAKAESANIPKAPPKSRAHTSEAAKGDSSVADPTPADSREDVTLPSQATSSSTTTSHARATQARVAPSPRVESAPAPASATEPEPVRLALRTTAAPAPSDDPEPTTEARTPPADPGRDRRRAAPGTRTVIQDEFLVEGKLEKPSAYYILRRSSLDYDWARLDAKFSPLVLESVQDPLF